MGAAFSSQGVQRAHQPRGERVRTIFTGTVAEFDADDDQPGRSNRIALVAVHHVASVQKGHAPAVRVVYARHWIFDPLRLGDKQLEVLAAYSSP